MRSRRLSYADAVRLIGGEDPVVGVLNRVSGVAAAAVTVASAGTVDFFALRGELVQWGNKAATSLRERLNGVRRFDRTDRLVAAHAVIVVTAFYEALDLVLAGHDVDLGAAELVAGEQVALATGAPATTAYADMVQALIDTPPPMPAPHLPFEDVLLDVATFYGDVSKKAGAFLDGLRAFENGQVDWSRWNGLIDLAVERYTQAYRTLVSQAPEFGVWSGMVDTQATRSLVRSSAAELTALLTELRSVTGGGVDAALQGLGKRYRASLDAPILASADAPSHVVLPTLGAGYVDPRGRVALAGPSDLPATETWWDHAAEVPDVQGLLLAHVSGPDATAGPLVVLGQPGSGKSAMTRVLAARLPAADFLVIRVELRTVPADAPIQAQIEGALLQMLGEHVTWPDLARRAGAALPVVILDGFDELLQTTGMNRADYLEQIKHFQQREEELDRPVAVLVTSRTVVADRARFPADSIVVRLEPFSRPQVRAWLGVWKAHNEAGLRDRSLSPLPADTAFAYGELAAQPLLLLLLALYDASANALQRSNDGIGRVELYERLFADFVEREVDKHGRDLPDDRRREESAAEWRRLSAVAIATLNRGGDVILEAELDADIPHLLWEADLHPVRADAAHRALTVSQRMVGRFFFIHESRATRDTGAPERSFEFLHATFGDFLAARQIVATLVDLAAERIHQQGRPQGRLDPGPLYAATSFVTVARRAPLWEFCRGLLAGLSADDRRGCRELVLELLPDAGYPHPTWSRSGYEPRRLPVAVRHAAFSANLVCFAVLLTDGPVDVAELVGEPVVGKWRRQALLWQSQLDKEDRQRLWQTLRVAWDLDTDPTRLQVRPEDGVGITVYTSLPWPPDERPVCRARDLPSPAAPVAMPDVVLPADSAIGRLLRRSAFVQTAHEMRELVYALAPVIRQVGGDLNWFTDSDIRTSHLALLLELLVVPPERKSSTRRWTLYQAALAIAAPPAYRHRIVAQLAVETPNFAASELINIFAFLQGFDTLVDIGPLSDVIASVAARPDLLLARQILQILRTKHPSAELLDLPYVRDQIIRAFGRHGLPESAGADLIDGADRHVRVTVGD